MFVMLMTAGLLIAAFPPAGTDKPTQTFSSPETASSALYTAVRDGDDAVLMRILGATRELVTLEDKGADSLEREKFLIKYEEMHRFVQEDDQTTVLYIGAENWPFPVPLRTIKAGWYFDARAGAQEVLYRQIGRNEDATIQAVHFLVLAQRAYRSTLHSDDTNSHYATRFVSTQGNQDGLYYGEDSPVPDFVANAGVDDTSAGAAHPSPYAGYNFRILTGQGKSATSGAKNYFSNGELSGGFAFVAYPATYGKSGVMTFIVNEYNVVYARDLGPDTAKIAQSMTRYDPDKNWHAAE
jgi:hypothetical protein